MSAADLRAKDHRDLLDIIDQLRSQGVSRYVDLPQIIVCGDQSAGKSSVLEAVSNMSFPMKDNVCTLFATELILRRGPLTNPRISINPAPERPPEERESLSKWQPTSDLEERGLGQIVEEAKKEMGLGSSKLFSNDVLRVELSGPEQPHLTMVDLPGLYKTGTKDQPQENVQTVLKMVTDYMENPRSIILAVVSAKADYVLQEVTSFAKSADPDGLRTLGLITKPDTLDTGSDSERSWVDIAMNKDVVLKLGWHVVKNRSYEEKHFTLDQRNAAEEEFFEKGIWNSIDPNIRGIKSLRVRLSTVLKQQIVRQLPSLIRDVELKVEDCSAKLSRLGEPRTTLIEQSRYLSRVSNDFTSLIRDAIRGTYNNSFFGNPKVFHGYEKRLRAVVQNQLVCFSSKMRESGESEIIIDSDSEECYDERHITRGEYIDKVKGQMLCSKGCELPGLFNPLIIGELFSQQCEPWRGIVAETIDGILTDVYRGTRLILEETATEEVAEELLVLINNGIEELKMDMDQKIDELLQSHCGSHAITYNPRLTENVQEAQRIRNRRSIEKKIRKTFGTKPFRDPHADYSQIVELFLSETEPDSERFGSALATDYMQAYYKVALDRFIDDISLLAVEGCLISRLPTLLDLKRIQELDESEITRLVGESEETVNERNSLTEKQMILKKGLQDIKRLYTHRDFGDSIEQAVLDSQLATKKAGEMDDDAPSHLASPPEETRPLEAPSEVPTLHQTSATHIRLESLGHKSSSRRGNPVVPSAVDRSQVVLTHPHSTYHDAASSSDGETAPKPPIPRHPIARLPDGRLIVRTTEDQI